MVEIDSNSVVGNILDDALNAHSFGGHHGHERSLIDTLGIKLTVDYEERLIKFLHQLGIALTKRLDGRENEVELVAGVESLEVRSERLEHTGLMAEDETIGLGSCKLID